MGHAGMEEVAPPWGHRIAEHHVLDHLDSKLDNAFLRTMTMRSAPVSARARSHGDRGWRTSQEGAPLGMSCGFNYLKARQKHLHKLRDVKPTQAAAGELCLAPRLPTNIPPMLPSSIHRGRSQKAPPAVEPASHAYQWVPVHVRQGGEAADLAAGKTIRGLQQHSYGTYVNTLTLALRKETFAGATSHILRLDAAHFEPRGVKPWCYLLDASSPIVTIKGVVVRVGPGRPREEHPEPMVIARLPAGLRPSQPLRFAALSRQATEIGTLSQRLLALTVHPSGWITAEAGPKGREEVEVGSSIDLSAIRFCTGRGIPLVDDVRLHVCNVAGTRVVCLQGDLNERCFDVHGRKPLALLPESCRPAEETHFIVSGQCGGFHLLTARPFSSFTAGSGGDICWKDGKWNRDVLSLNGIIFEVSIDSLRHPNPLESRETGESQVIAVLDFQKYLVRRFGSIENAWRTEFDPEGQGAVTFTGFGFGCKAAGYVGNPSRLWASFDQDLDGYIPMERLSFDWDGLLAKIRSEKRERGVPTDTIITASLPRAYPAALSGQSLRLAPAHLDDATMRPPSIL